MKDKSQKELELLYEAIVAQTNPIISTEDLFKKDLIVCYFPNDINKVGFKSLHIKKIDHDHTLCGLNVKDSKVTTDIFPDTHRFYGRYGEFCKQCVDQSDYIVNKGQ